MASLGVDRQSLTFLGFPDEGLCELASTYLSAKMQAFRSPYTGRISPPVTERVIRGVRYRGSDVRRELERLLVDFSPNVVVIPHPEDAHPDHCSAHIFIREALDAMAARGRPRPRILHYLIHYHQWPLGTDAGTGGDLQPPAGFPPAEGRWESLGLTRRRGRSQEAGPVGLPQPDAGDRTVHAGLRPEQRAVSRGRAGVDAPVLVQRRKRRDRTPALRVPAAAGRTMIAGRRAPGVTRRVSRSDDRRDDPRQQPWRLEHGVSSVAARGLEWAHRGGRGVSVLCLHHGLCDAVRVRTQACGGDRAGTPRDSRVAAGSRPGRARDWSLNLVAALPHVGGLRIPGVLQRLGITYLLTALIVRSCGAVAQGVIAFALMAAHWAAMTVRAIRRACRYRCLKGPQSRRVYRRTRVWLPHSDARVRPRRTPWHSTHGRNGAHRFSCRTMAPAPRRSRPAGRRTRRAEARR